MEVCRNLNIEAENSKDVFAAQDWAATRKLGKAQVKPPEIKDTGYHPLYHAE